MTSLLLIRHILIKNGLKNTLHNFKPNYYEINQIVKYLENDIVKNCQYDVDYNFNQPIDFLISEDSEFRTRILYWPNKFVLPFHYHPDTNKTGMKILKGQLYEKMSFQERYLNENDYSILDKNEGHTVCSIENSVTLNICEKI